MLRRRLSSSLIYSAHCYSIARCLSFDNGCLRSDAPSLIARPSPRFFDIYRFGNKEAIKKERERLSDEMNRGYFADMSELKKHGGKIGMANKTIVPSMVAKKFPALDVEFSNGRKIKLPIAYEEKESNANQMAIPHSSLLCLHFRASSQAMIDSWSKPFEDAFSNSRNVQLYEVYIFVRPVWKNSMARFWVGYTRRGDLTCFMYFPIVRREIRSVGSTNLKSRKIGENLILPSNYVPCFK
ncbi:uncharacterized protein LOC18429366 isoform X2 [Amborella trichopoda]|uniref:uncharacterized protein LOC18429366 isoform X2 n=1 Tax=Amborella trichopoda TaxID=13333 RepID=UPI0009BFE848|nr:uncharacterized protein LOC18429366 isoform X2 [Amborella trichopoda]|eukprot:XP_020520238.1 uncharacterized protein LOC18429366 isoform X2 [Amborella trichopoda]